jgi:hypothetical protein
VEFAPRQGAFLWSFFPSKKNRELIAWWGGGAVIVISGLWAAFVYFFPPKSDVGSGKSGVSASSGGVAVGGNVSGSTITTGRTTDSNSSKTAK